MSNYFINISVVREVLRKISNKKRVGMRIRKKGARVM